MKKPTVYLETSLISAYWYEGADVAMLARRLRTREWWDLEREHFGRWSSIVSESELRNGTFPRQDECLKMVRRLRYLPPLTATGRELVDEILRRGIVPPTKEADAAHLALCATHGMDYLL